MKTHYCILYYNGKKIIVENYLYKLASDPTKKYFTVQEVMNVIDGKCEIGKRKLTICAKK